MSLQFKFIQQNSTERRVKGWKRICCGWVSLSSYKYKNRGKQKSFTVTSPWNIIAIRIGYFGNSFEFNSIFIAFKSNLILYLQFACSNRSGMNGAQIQIDNVSKSETQEPTECTKKYRKKENIIRRKIECHKNMRHFAFIAFKNFYFNTKLRDFSFLLFFLFLLLVLAFCEFGSDGVVS